MTTPAILKETEQELTCALCLEILTEPKTLSCFHSFCQDCLFSWAEKLPKPLTQLRCPQCAHITDLPSGDFHQLRTNFHLRNIIAQYHKIAEYTSSSPPLSRSSSSSIPSSSTTIPSSAIPSTSFSNNNNNNNHVNNNINNNSYFEKKLDYDDWILPPTLRRSSFTTFNRGVRAITCAPRPVSQSLSSRSSSSLSAHWSDFDGADGRGGVPGINGEDGGNAQPLDLVLIEGDARGLVYAVGRSISEFQFSESRTRMHVEAVGEDGKSGTHGSAGEDGRPGRNGTLDHPSGFNGGRGGTGGSGGNGGNGGQGGRVRIFAEDSRLFVLLLVNCSGGDGGDPGQGGEPGAGGAGGRVFDGRAISPSPSSSSSLSQDDAKLASKLASAQAGLAGSRGLRGQAGSAGRSGESGSVAYCVFCPRTGGVVEQSDALYCPQIVDVQVEGAVEDDGVWEPGEHVTVRFRLANSGGMTLPAGLSLAFSGGANCTLLDASAGCVSTLPVAPHRTSDERFSIAARIGPRLGPCSFTLSAALLGRALGSVTHRLADAAFPVLLVRPEAPHVFQATRVARLRFAVQNRSSLPVGGAGRRVAYRAVFQSPYLTHPALRRLSGSERGAMVEVLGELDDVLPHESACFDLELHVANDPPPFKRIPISVHLRWNARDIVELRSECSVQLIREYFPPEDPHRPSILFATNAQIPRKLFRRIEQYLRDLALPFSVWDQDWYRGLCRDRSGTPLPWLGDRHTALISACASAEHIAYLHGTDLAALFSLDPVELMCASSVLLPHEKKQQPTAATERRYGSSGILFLDLSALPNFASRVFARLAETGPSWTWNCNDDFGDAFMFTQRPSRADAERKLCALVQEKDRLDPFHFHHGVMDYRPSCAAPSFFRSSWSYGSARIFACPLMKRDRLLALHEFSSENAASILLYAIITTLPPALKLALTNSHSETIAPCLLRAISEDLFREYQDPESPPHLPLCTSYVELIESLNSLSPASLPSSSSSSSSEPNDPALPSTSLVSLEFRSTFAGMLHRIMDTSFFSKFSSSVRAKNQTITQLLHRLDTPPSPIEHVSLLNISDPTYHSLFLYQQL